MLYFRLQGRDSDLADFADLSHFSTTLTDCLRRIYRLQEPGSSRLPKYEVASLAIGSALVGLNGDPDLIENFVLATIRLRNRQLPEGPFSFDDIKAFRKLAKPLEHSTAAITIQDIPIDRQFIEGCDALLSSAVESTGEAIGSLDGLNVHTRNFFRLYPEGQDRGVECSFDPELYDTVCSALKSRVIVRGIIVRDPNGITIDRINMVTSIEVLPSPQSLPPISDLFGLFKATPVRFDSVAMDW